MLEMPLVSLRKSSELKDIKEVVHVVDGRKKTDVGYFIPKALGGNFEKYLAHLEHESKIKKLKRVAEAQRKDPIDEGGIEDGLE